MKQIESSGLYMIKDRYFQDFPNEKYMDNKNETRPHYYAIRDKSGLYWMIPISSKVAKFQAKIDSVEARFGAGSCFLFAIAPVYGKDRAFIISEMFPVTEEYILRPYSVRGTPYFIQSEAIQQMLRTKALRFLSMVERGLVRSPLNVLETRRRLLEK